MNTRTTTQRCIPTRQSIRTQGVLSPLLMRPVTENGFEIIAERGDIALRRSPNKVRFALLPAQIIGHF